MTSAKPERHVASHVFNIAVLIIGGAALMYLLDKLGWHNVKRVLGGVGGWFGVIIALDIGALACEAAAIREFMRPESRMAKYWRILAAQWSGRAINILTPGGALGEGVKVTMLVAHVPRGRVVSSIVLLNLAAFYLSVAILIVGVPLTALLVDLPRQLQLVVWIGLGVLIPLVIGLGIIIQRGAVGTALSGLQRMRILSAERAEKWKTRLSEIDKHIRELQSNRTEGTRLGLVFVCLARLCAWSAAAVVLYTVGVDISFTVLVGVFSVGVLIGWISAIVPFGLGVQDGSNYALFGVLGVAGPSGVFYTLLARARSLTLALLGLLIMAAGHVSTRLVIAKRNRLMARLEAEHGSESVARSG